ncbi:MAG: hypothetical protein KKB21_03475 [Nanoarchaeota archaeon]|nr:hypothetical protein [Nanoarchaeota archaeon]MBU4086610.1 hypothetical protein [Nanoarchaeota archaeon]
MKITLTLTLILTLIFLPSVLASCINSADDYAVEVVLNKPGIEYDLKALNNAQNIFINNGRYILKSDYSSSLAAILEEQTGLTTLQSSGLSVRLQIPVKAKSTIVPNLKFVSTGLKGMLNVSEEPYNGWKISCVDGNPIPQCEFKKGLTTISAGLVGQTKYEATIETNENLKECSSSCDGRCIGSINMKCIDKQLKDDIESMMKHSGLAKSFDEIASSYRIISSGNIQTTDIAPETSTEIDWETALSQQLRFLRLNKIIAITDLEIEQISSLAQAGAAGINSRIIYGEDPHGNETWLYYDKTTFPALTTLKNCKEFPLSSIPAGTLAFNTNISIPTYYLVPIIISISLITLFIFLLAVARLVNKNQKAQDN